MSISRGEFWIGIVGGTVVTLIGIALSFWQTGNQISETKKENQVGRSITALRDITSAINKVDEQLETHAGMYVEMERCLTSGGIRPATCWSRSYNFDGQASARAWSELETAIEASYPIVAGSAVDALDRLRAVREAHQSRVRPLLAPRTPDQARKLFDEIEVTRGSLVREKERLRQALIRPRR